MTAIHRAGLRSRTPGRRRAGAAEGAGRFTYVVLIVVALVSLFPLYWSLVVASHDNSAVSAYPPVLTAGPQLFHNIARLFNSGEVNVDFWARAGQLVHRRLGGHRLGRLLQRARRLRLREARASAAAKAPDGRDRPHDDGAGPARA